MHRALLEKISGSQQSLTGSVGGYQGDEGLEDGDSDSGSSHHEKWQGTDRERSDGGPAKAVEHSKSPVRAQEAYNRHGMETPVSYLSEEELGGLHGSFMTLSGERDAGVGELENDDTGVMSDEMNALDLSGKVWDVLAPHRSSLLRAATVPSVQQEHPLGKPTSPLLRGRSVTPTKSAVPPSIQLDQTYPPHRRAAGREPLAAPEPHQLCAPPSPYVGSSPAASHAAATPQTAGASTAAETRSWGSDSPTAFRSAECSESPDISRFLDSAHSGHFPLPDCSETPSVSDLPENLREASHPQLSISTDVNFPGLRSTSYPPPSPEPEENGGHRNSDEWDRIPRPNPDHPTIWQDPKTLASKRHYSISHFMSHSPTSPMGDFRDFSRAISAPKPRTQLQHPSPMGTWVKHEKRHLRKEEAIERVGSLPLPGIESSLDASSDQPCASRHSNHRVPQPPTVPPPAHLVETVRRAQERGREQEQEEQPQTRQKLQLQCETALDNGAPISPSGASPPPPSALADPCFSPALRTGFPSPATKPPPRTPVPLSTTRPKSRTHRFLSYDLVPLQTASESQGTLADSSWESAPPPICTFVPLPQACPPSPESRKMLIAVEESIATATAMGGRPVGTSARRRMSEPMVLSLLQAAGGAPLCRPLVGNSLVGGESPGLAGEFRKVKSVPQISGSILRRGSLTSISGRRRASLNSIVESKSTALGYDRRGSVKPKGEPVPARMRRRSSMVQGGGSSLIKRVEIGEAVRRKSLIVVGGEKAGFAAHDGQNFQDLQSPMMRGTEDEKWFTGVGMTRIGSTDTSRWRDEVSPRGRAPWLLDATKGAARKVMSEGQALVQGTSPSVEQLQGQPAYDSSRGYIVDGELRSGQDGSRESGISERGSDGDGIQDGSRESTAENVDQKRPFSPGRHPFATAAASPPLEGDASAPQSASPILERISQAPIASSSVFMPTGAGPGHKSAPLAGGRRKSSILLHDRPRVGMHAGAVAGGKVFRSWIDPLQAPRPADDKDSLREYRTKNVSVKPIPRASSKYRTIDNGNCTSRLIRMTANQLPSTWDLERRVGIPIGAVLQPLAEIPNHESPVPALIDPKGSASGPARCTACKAYLNCHTQFSSEGRMWQCCLCGLKQKTYRSYFCRLNSDGKRTDTNQKVELCRGVWEYFPSESSAAPVVPTYLFVLDVSLASVNSGVLRSSVAAVRGCLDWFDSVEGLDPKLRVGIIVFDQMVHFFDLRKPPQHDMLPEVSVMPDVDDPFVPHPYSVVSFFEQRDNIYNLLDCLPSIFQPAAATPHSAGGAALKASALALKDTGGKVVAVLGGPVTVGFGSVARQDSVQHIGTSSEKDLLSPASSHYPSLARKCAGTLHVSIDLFVCSWGFMDLASLGVLTRLTGGQLSLMTAFTEVEHAARLMHEMERNVRRRTGFRAVLRTQCSAGFEVASKFGCFPPCKPDGDILIPCIDQDKTLALEIRLAADLPHDVSSTIIQCTLAYTGLDGVRRVRVMTLAVQTSSSISGIFRSADPEAIATYLVKKAAFGVPTQSIRVNMNLVEEEVVAILCAYRKYCQKNKSPEQLILPEGLKFLPLFCLGIHKLRAFSTDTLQHVVPTDERIYHLQLLMTMSGRHVNQRLYPHFLPVHNLEKQHGSMDHVGYMILPKRLRLSVETVEVEGAYLLSDGASLFLWIQRDVSPDFIEKIFGVRDIDVVSTLTLRRRDNSLSRQLHCLVDNFRSGFPIKPEVRVATHRNAHYISLYNYLVEDKGSCTVSYLDFLCKIHASVQQLLTISI